jgi:hypothetical protein
MPQKLLQILYILTLTGHRRQSLMPHNLRLLIILNAFPNEVLILITSNLPQYKAYLVFEETGLLVGVFFRDE